ncbi:slipin family protein [Alicyclobacillus acidiphilus]|uniref:slipin family protein n=1 Tax=Alicyclobacillus acidiphilus TaxID=182455 RepID=UPI000832E0E5|nr:slipin family protein [Alicyclobacillus acidiphilus]
MGNLAYRKVTGLQQFIFVACLIIGVGLAALLFQHSRVSAIVVGIVVILAGWFLSAAIRVADQWEKAVVLRLGKFHRLAGPGLFTIIPFVDTVPRWVDQRVMTTKFTAESTLSKDTVPVSVDAVLFWMVWDAEKAALEVADYENSVSWAAQTALRDIIGRTMLESMLSGRERIDQELKRIMDERTEPWGITIQNVQIRDINIPLALQDAMSRAAQAEREREARNILGESEKQIAESFLAAAEMYRSNPAAMQLRALNILYEGLKEKASMIVVPSSLADSANIGNIMGLVNAEAALNAQNAKEKR